MEGRILVAHRNELILDVIQEMLQNVGYAATLTTDGHQALAKAMSEHYHLVIVDRHLAGDMDGARLVERLRKYGIKTPIIGTAPESTWTAQDETATSEIDYFLPSPFGYHELIRAAETLLNRSLTPPLPVDDTPSLEEFEADLSPPVPEAKPPESARPRPQADRRQVRTAPRPSGYRSWQPRALERHEGPPRILLIDNNDEDRGRIAGSLREAGYEVTALKSGREAYEHTMLNNYELIFTDLWLVGLDGFETIDAMRKSGVTAPIAVLTAYVTRDMVQELLQSRVCKVFVKPVKPETLRAFVDKTAKVC